MARSNKESDLRAAVAGLVQQKDFRLFIRAFLDGQGALENSGMGVNPFNGNALTTAYESGKMAASGELIALIATVSPTFFATVILENHNARSGQPPERTSDLDPDESGPGR